MNIHGSLMDIYDEKNKEVYDEKKRHLCRKKNENTNKNGYMLL